jgi:hypothetical protein
LSFGESKDTHRNDRRYETGEDDPFSAIEVQYPPTQNSARNEYDSNRGKEKPGIGYSSIDCIEREKGGDGPPDEVIRKTYNRWRKSFPTKKETIFIGGILYGSDLSPSQSISNE